MLLFWLPSYPEVMESFILNLAKQYEIKIFCLKKPLDERINIYHSKLSAACTIKYIDYPADYVDIMDIIKSEKDTVQIFGGFLGKVGEILKLYNSMSLNKAVILTEKPSVVPYDHFNKIMRAIKTFRAKKIYYNAYKSVEQSVAGIFVTGLSGMKLFESYGMPSSKLFNFMYTHIDDVSTTVQMSEKSATDRIRFLYIGRFEYLERGIDNLIYAFNKQTSQNWSLDLVGGYGKDADEIIQWAEKMKNVQYIGSWKSDEVIKNMQKYDVCISPTRLDGWRIQVNQAIVAGIATITTNEAVSDELIRASNSGLVVDAFNKSELCHAVMQVIETPSRVKEWKENAKRFSKYIQNEAVADYFIASLNFCISHEGERPICPWIKTIH